MNIRRPLPIASFAALAFLAFLQTGTAAQSLTGTLVGTVSDAQGGVLAGAVVRITSPSLMRGEEHTLSMPILLRPPATCVTRATSTLPT